MRCFTQNSRRSHKIQSLREHSLRDMRLRTLRMTLQIQARLSFPRGREVRWLGISPHNGTLVWVTWELLVKFFCHTHSYHALRSTQWVSTDKLQIQAALLWRSRYRNDGLRASRSQYTKKAGYARYARCCYISRRGNCTVSLLIVVALLHCST